MTSARPDDAFEPVAAETRDELAATRSELVGLLRTEETAEQTLERLATLACAAVPGAAVGSVTLWQDGQPYTVVSSDPLAEEIDTKQYEVLEGPCLDASRYGQPYLVPDMAAEQRWPVFSDVAALNGIGSSLSLPLTARGDVIGALNLYSREPHAFDGAVEIAGQFAVQAGITIANAAVYRASRRLAEELQEAMSSRAVIEQAKGVLMAEQGCTADGAFTLLRLASQRENVKIRDIAARIVEAQTSRKH